MESNNNSSAVPIFAISKNTAILMTEFRGLEIYASCAIAIYFYELIVCSLSKDIKWYKMKLWSVPEVVCFFLEKFTTTVFCVISLFFLHYISHTQLSCTVLLLLQQGFFALSTTFHCFMLLIKFRVFYPKYPYLTISLFLFAVMTVLFQLINVLGFGEVKVNQLDGNCYLSNALDIEDGGDDEEEEEKILSGFFSIGFILLMIYCWIIWGFISYSIHSTRNLHFFSRKRYWRRILFDDGFMYLSLIALSQAINVIFIFDGKNYLRKYVNTTPLLILTSICAQKLIVKVSPSNNNNNNNGRDSFHLFSSINEKNIGNSQQSQNQQFLGNFIDQFYGNQNQSQPQQRQVQNYPQQPQQRQVQNYPQQPNNPQQSNQQQQNQWQPNQQQVQSYPQQLNLQQDQQIDNKQKEFSLKIPSPTYSSFTTSTKVNSIPPSLPPIIIHRNTTSDIDEGEEVRYSYTDYDDKLHLNPHDEQRTTQDFGSSLLNYFNSLTLSRCSSPVTSTNPVDKDNIEARNSEQFNSKISKISRLSNLNMNGSDPRLSQGKGIRKSQRPSQPILVDPNDIYYFTYSYDDDNEIYLFPAIQIQSDQQEEGTSSSNNNARKSNESLTPPSIRHQSFAFTGKVIADNKNDNNLLDNKKIVRGSDVQNVLSKKKSLNEYGEYGFI
ncbi:hypothetical protein C1645_870612 [Glomus cerebriforme]|uniref:Uncharacterized protein n=1 Tax=Glomus cerebriforme TaxID=658196 RepID=A0A397TUD4_9GLOM|nr:hypothetical protein C1645_870612 [Glomus cerebriforme]